MHGVAAPCKQTVMKLYTPIYSPRIVKSLFHPNARVDDKVMNMRVAGIDDITSYMDDCAYAFQDVFLTRIERISDDTYKACWMKIKSDDGKRLYGTDHVRVENAQITDLHVALNELRTMEYNDLVDYGMLME